MSVEERPNKNFLVKCDSCEKELVIKLPEVTTSILAARATLENQFGGWVIVGDQNICSSCKETEKEWNPENKDWWSVLKN